MHTQSLKRLLRRFSTRASTRKDGSNERNFSKKSLLRRLGLFPLGVVVGMASQPDLWPLPLPQAIPFAPLQAWAAWRDKERGD